MLLPYFIEYSAHFFYMKNDAEIFPVHDMWKVAEKRFKMACMMNNLQLLILVKLFLKNKIFFLTKIIVKFRCALYLHVHYAQ